MFPSLPIGLDVAEEEVATPLAQSVIGKRAFDLIVATVLLLLLSPIILVAALAVKATSSGPIFFRQRRVGRDGVAFDILKFRTMHRDAELHLASSADLYRDYLAAGYKLSARDDPRVTPSGRWLRRFDIDELPQLWNVVRGDMSLVGPRPVPERELRQYQQMRAFYEAVRPGITGLWQVSGRNRLSYDERVALDVAYVRTMSPTRDLTILILTLPALVRGGGTLVDV